MSFDDEPGIGQADQPPIDWAVVVRHFLPQGLRLAIRYCGDIASAEDALQDALLKIVRSKDSFRHESSLQTWLSRIVINSCRDWLAKHRRNQPSQLNLLDDLLESALLGPGQKMQSQEAVIQIRQAVEQLPDRQREVLVLSVWEQLETSQIAEVLEMSHQNVYATLSVARKNLRNALQPLLGDGGREKPNTKTAQTVQADQSHPADQGNRNNPTKDLL